MFGQGQDGKTPGDQAAGSGATDIFGVIATAKREEPQAPEPEGRTAPPRVHSVVFKSDASRVEETDQLLNLLRSPAAVAPVPTPAPVPTSGGFTQLLRALNYEQAKEAAPPAEAIEMKVQPEAVPVAPAAEAKSAALPRVTSFQPPSASPLMATPVIEARAEPEAAPESFTQLFQSVTAPALEPKVESPVAAVPGSFTQVFRALEAAPEVVKAEQAAEAPAALAVPAPVAEAGSFTRMFEAASAGPVVAPVVVPIADPAGPGSFTQVFRALNAAPVEAQAETKPSESPAAPGSFTEMFQAVSEVPKETTASAPTASTPGSFTQMFRALDAALAPVSQPAGSSGQASPAPGAYRPEAEPVKGAPVFAPAAVPTPPQTPIAASGGLTQLLRALDRPGQPVVPLYAPPPAAEASPVQQQGSFTSVYGKLDTNAAAPPASAPVPAAPPAQVAERYATQAFHLPQAPAASQSAAPAQAGPSEFTRILNASMVREAALRGGAPETQAAPAPAATAPSVGPPAFGGISAMPTAPKMPEPPKIKMPELPKALAVGGMQQYVPLLLILVIFLLLAILVAVVFLMKK